MRNHGRRQKNVPNTVFAAQQLCLTSACMYFVSLRFETFSFYLIFFSLIVKSFLCESKKICFAFQGSTLLIFSLQEQSICRMEAEHHASCIHFIHCCMGC